MVLPSTNLTLSSLCGIKGYATPQLDIFFSVISMVLGSHMIKYPATRSEGGKAVDRVCVSWGLKLKA